ncbi:MAG: FAD-dependent oxidoreductase [Candidatus Theseobacter exili]|nr:FAD-dependent oxidoreductase [Candidatus Theseobacter exili]
MGAGHAGVSAATAAASKEADVTLFSDEPCSLPYYRPRLIAFAFGQASENGILMHPLEWYIDNGIDLKINTAVKEIDTSSLSIITDSGNHSFDSIIVSIGAGPIVPPFVKEITKTCLPLWNIENAKTIRSALNKPTNILIVGGGVIGVETALRALDSGHNVSIIEREARLMPRNFSVKASDMIRQHLEKKGINILLQTEVKETFNNNESTITSFSDGKQAEYGLVLLSIGALRKLSLANASDIKTGKGIITNTYLQTLSQNIYACGDIAQLNSIVQCSAKEATIQGRVAALNSLASVTGGNFSEYIHSYPAVSLKYGDFEIHSMGNVPENETEEHIFDGSDENTYRACIVKKEKTVGIQMIGTGKDFNKLANTVKHI